MPALPLNDAVSLAGDLRIVRHQDGEWKGKRSGIAWSGKASTKRSSDMLWQSARRTEVLRPRFR